MRARTQKGFTLVELLVAMAIIAVLIGLGVGAISIAQRVSRDNQRRAAVSEVNAAIQAYYGSNGSYPANGDFTVSASSISLGDDAINLEGPATASSDATTDSTASATSYCYENTSDGYLLAAKLEDGNTYGDLSTGSGSCDFAAGGLDTS